MKDESLFVAERRRMVEEQLLGRDIRDVRVLEAMQAIPRHSFIPPEHRHLAYADGPLPIGNEQTISQPYIVALMTQLLELVGSENVLEVGTGSGYQAAILGYLAREVHTIERYSGLARHASRILEDLGIHNVHVHIGDGTQGVPEFAPYAAITVTAAAPDVPRALLDQLDDGGRLVIPVGTRGGQTLERWFRRGPDFMHEPVAPVAFVPLLGRYGWQDDRQDFV
jgi:protein-L-isoaspartate(D-aspartate) O-methyltransferase